MCFFFFFCGFFAYWLQFWATITYTYHVGGITNCYHWMLLWVYAFVISFLQKSFCFSFIYILIYFSHHPSNRLVLELNESITNYSYFLVQSIVISRKHSLFIAKSLEHKYQLFYHLVYSVFCFQLHQTLLCFKQVDRMTVFTCILKS